MEFSKQMFAVKSIRQLEIELASDNQLRRVLGPWALTALGVGAIIGAGIFVLTGLAAHDYAGPALVLSFVVAGLGCAFAALCYAEFAAMIPVAGSAYTYAYATMGELLAWIIGWDLILEYGMASSTVAYGWSKYFLHFLELFGITIPASLTTDPFNGGLFNLPAAGIVLLVTVVLVIGIRESASFNATMVVLKLAVVLFVIAAGIPHVDAKNWDPFMPNGFSGVARGAAYVFFAYIGFDSVSTHAEEARRPQRDVPFALIGSLVVCTVLFMMMMTVVTGLVDYRTLNVANPVAIAIKAAGAPLRWLMPVVEIGATVGMASVLLVIIMVQSRVLFAMAQDGLLPAPLGRLHERWKTPVAGTVLTAAVAAVLGVLVPIGVLGQMVSIGVLTAFIAVALAVLVWRRRRPEAPRPFRTPGVPLVPIGAILVCGYMMAGLPTMTWWRFAGWLLLGLGIYWLYGARSGQRLAARSHANP